MRAALRIVRMIYPSLSYAMMWRNVIFAAYGKNLVVIEKFDSVAEGARLKQIKDVVEKTRKFLM